MKGQFREHMYLSRTLAAKEFHDPSVVKYVTWNHNLGISISNRSIRRFIPQYNVVGEDRLTKYGSSRMPVGTGVECK